jgi:hypothetical protein
MKNGQVQNGEESQEERGEETAACKDRLELPASERAVAHIWFLFISFSLREEAKVMYYNVLHSYEQAWPKRLRS